MLYETPIRPDELYHFGVMGQRWGRRQYQNPDGSWTELGNARRRIGPGYGNGRQAYIKKGRRHSAAADVARRGRHIRSYTTGRSNRQYTYADVRRNRERTSPKTSSDGINLTKEQKEALKKALITGVVVAGAVGAAIAIRNHGRNTADRILKSGINLQTVTRDVNRFDHGDSVFATYKGSDKLTYKALFGGFKDKATVSATLSKDAKIASRKSGKDVYDYLMKNNKEFRDLVTNTPEDLKITSDYDIDKIISNPSNKGYYSKEFYDKVKAGKYAAGIKTYNQDKQGVVRRTGLATKGFDELDLKVKNSKYNNTPLRKITKGAADKVGKAQQKNLTGYDAFNFHSLASDDGHSKRLREIYYDELKKRGYSGVVDVNDSNFSAMRGHSPIIFFDRDKLTKEGKNVATKIAYDQDYAQESRAKKAANKYKATLGTLNSAKNYVLSEKHTAAGIAGGAGGLAGRAVYKKSLKEKERESKQNASKARVYSSNMSQAQIAKRLGVSESTVSKYLSDRNKTIKFREQRARRSRIQALYNSGLTQEEIARRLGISISTVNAAL